MIRRGEGGGCGVGWAFRVARGWGGDRVPPRWEPREQDAGDPEGPPIHSQPPSPLRLLMGLFLG